MKALKIDPEFQSLIPPLSDEEFQQLKENIIKDGCRDSLVLWNGAIVDGHNRYKICQENDISFKTEEKDFTDREQAVEWIIRNQFGRRNLSPTQRCELALKLKPMIQKKAKENLKSSGENYGKGSLNSANPIKSIDTRKELAKIAGMAPDTFSKAEKILEKGSPEQIERAKKGGSGNSVNAIYKDVTGKKALEKIRPKEGVPKPEENNDNEVFVHNDENGKDGQPTYKGQRYDPTNYKICSNCHTLMPLTAYLDSELNGYSDDVCGGCIRVYCELAGKKMKRGRRIKTKEEKEADKALLDALYGKVERPADTIEIAIDAFKTDFESFLKNADLSLMLYLTVIKDEENNKKLMAALSEAVAAMEKWKGKYLYEKL